MYQAFCKEQVDNALAVYCLVFLQDRQMLLSQRMVSIRTALFKRVHNSVFRRKRRTTNLFARFGLMRVHRFWEQRRVGGHQKTN